jgi:uncharacterized membrane protein
VLTREKIAFLYLDSDTPFALPGEGCQLAIFSDYPAARMNADAMTRLVGAVADGMGLLMIGGWESYHGLGGDWDATALASALPVTMRNDDDRVNSPVPLLIEARGEHPILAGLPWDAPPAVGGYNRIVPKPDAQELLSLRAMQPTRSAGDWSIALGKPEPLLVVGAHGLGRTAALATDVAPHWVGTLVDWGLPRVAARADGGREIEVGAHYAQFFAQLVRWTMGEK